MNKQTNKWIRQVEGIKDRTLLLILYVDLLQREGEV